MCPNENTDFIPNEWLTSKKKHRAMPKWLRITLLCVLGVLIVAAALYFIPKTTPIDVTVDAVKMDQAGNELGTVQLHIKGVYREYLFREPLMELEIDPFGNYMNIQGGGLHFLELPERDFDMGSMLLTAYQVTENRMCTLNMVFTDSFDRFMISDGDSNSTEFSYVASISGKYAARETVEYINSFYHTGITLPEA